MGGFGRGRPALRGHPTPRGGVIYQQRAGGVAYLATRRHAARHQTQRPWWPHAQAWRRLPRRAGAVTAGACPRAEREVRDAGRQARGREDREEEEGAGGET